MSRFQVLGLPERVIRGAASSLGRDRLEEETDVIAEIQPVKYPPDEPVRALLQDRHPGWPGLPCTTGELVDDVTGAAAEQLNQRLGLPRHEVHRQLRRAHRDPV